ncbi:hypothetical protein ACTACG_17165 [Pseudomonas syringae]|uniref:hypothetical protein n=1 Tax=Pseudomonas syringae TaxID=317 RepID=UPI003F753E2B
MDAKDQRLEIRIPQQQLDELDAIRESVDSTFTPTRSDIVRMFIAQGIERINKPQTSVPENLNLGERLTLFFQMEQVRLLERALEPKQGNANYNYHNPDMKVKPSTTELIKRVYLNGYSWFFELDEQSLGKLDSSLRADAVVALMNETPNDETSKNISYATSILAMFRDIERCMRNQNNNYQLVEFIENLSKHKKIPLSFTGFPASSKTLNEMVALKNYADGECSYLRLIEDQDDLSEKYSHLLNAYSEIEKHHHQLDIESLQKIMMSNF